MDVATTGWCSKSPPWIPRTTAAGTGTEPRSAVDAPGPSRQRRVSVGTAGTGGNRRIVGPAGDEAVQLFTPVCTTMQRFPVLEFGLVVQICQVCKCQVAFRVFSRHLRIRTTPLRFQPDSCGPINSLSAQRLHQAFTRPDFHHDGL